MMKIMKKTKRIALFNYSEAIYKQTRAKRRKAKKENRKENKFDYQRVTFF